MKYTPTTERRPHPAYRRRVIYWATVADSAGRHVEQRGPYRNKREAFADAVKMTAAREARESDNAM